jgi:hypothetical protein
MRVKGSIDPRILALYSHWCTADSVRVFIHTPLPPEAVDLDLPDDDQRLGAFASALSRLSVWYSLLYVVVEGYQEINPNDHDVDTLLENQGYVDYLRIFRNATFHYQKDPLTEKARKFLCAEDSEKWIRRLNKALDKFFLKTLPIMEDIDAIKAAAFNKLH